MSDVGFHKNVTFQQFYFRAVQFVIRGLGLTGYVTDMKERGFAKAALSYAGRFALGATAR